MRLESVRKLLSKLASGQVKESPQLELDPSLTESERELGRFVLPLFRDKDKQLGEMAGKARALQAALDQISVPAIVLDAQGGLLTMNRSVAQLLRVAAVPASLLKEARIACAAREPEERLAQVELPAGETLRLRVVPTEGPDVDRSARVVFLLRVGAALPLDRALLARRHGLTPKEAEVVEWAAAGLTNKEIGEKLEVAPETVRTHVSSALLKTGARNRAGLVSVAFASLLGIGAAE